MVDNILAVDPGGTTGIAMFTRAAKIWQTWELPYEPIKLYEFFGVALSHPPITAICERFDYRPVGKYNFGGSRAVPKVDLTPREVIGILKLACDYAGMQIHWQAPADVNGQQGGNGKDQEVFWTDERVKKLGLYKPGHVHEMDAVKHILYYRAFKRNEQGLLEALRPLGKYTEQFEEVMT